MTTPRVLVLMAAYNGRPWIEEQVASILAQQGVEVSLVISDDGSTDGTRECLAELAARHPNVVLSPPTAPSGSAAANFTRLLVEADLGQADYVALADQDDVWLPSKLERACRCLADDPGVDGYSSNVDALFEDGRRKRLDKASPQRAWDHYFESPGPGCSFVLSRRLMAGLVPLLTQLRQRGGRLFAYHDWFIYAYARHAGFRWFIDPASTMLYRQHGGNVVGANVGLRSSLRRLQRMRDGWYFDEVRWQMKLLRELLPDGVSATGAAATTVDGPPASAPRPTPALDPALVDTRGPGRRWRFVREVAPQSRRRWQDRIWLAACVLTGIVR